MASTATQTAKSKIPDNDPGTRQSTTPEYTKSTQTAAAEVDPSSVGEARNQQQSPSLLIPTGKPVGKGMAQQKKIGSARKLSFMETRAPKVNSSSVAIRVRELSSTGAGF